MHKTDRNAVFLVDGKFIYYRSLYALLKTDLDSMESSLYYLFVKTLLSIAKGIQTKRENLIPKPIIICWDSKHSYRKMAFPAYKKKHRTISEDVRKLIAKSLPNLMNWMHRIGLLNVYFPGYEADDVFAAYTTRIPECCYVVISNDEDIYQLLNKKVCMCKLKKDKKLIYTCSDFEGEHDDIRASDWAYVKAIAGCKSDCIPGVNGIGEKRAIRFIKGELDDRSSKKILDNNRLVLFYYTLVKLPYLNKKLPVEVVERKFNFEEFTKFCQIYNLRSFIYKLDEFQEVFG